MNIDDKGWSRFYNFNEVLVIKPYADPDAEKHDWSCLYKDQAANLSMENGCTLKEEDGKLGHRVCGIYWIRFTKTDEHPSKFYDYIGLAARRKGSRNQTGIYTRLADHVRKIQHFPHRGKIGRYMYIKQHDNDNTVKEIGKILVEDDSQLLKKYQTELNEHNFNDYQEIRDFFRDKNDKDQIENSSTKEFINYFNSHKAKLKDYESSKSFLEKNMQVRFFDIPEQERDGLYIELAEALSIHAYKEKFKDKPMLNHIDESMKLDINGKTRSISKKSLKDIQFDLEKDTKFVKEEIGILNGFWDFDQQD